MELLLTNALAHEFQRSRDSFASFVGLHYLIVSGNGDTDVALATYNSYSDFVAHLYEFYLGCIKNDCRFPRNISGKAVDAILNEEVTKLLKMRRNKILRGDAPSYENDISHYEVEVPSEFGCMFRTVRNIRSHAFAERSKFDLAEFFNKYHRFIYLLFEEPQWIWNIEKVSSHDWLAIQNFSKVLSRNSPHFKNRE